MRINLTDILVSESKTMEKEIFPEFTVYDNKNGKFPIEWKKPVSVFIQNVGTGKLLLKGEAEFCITIPCDRCLEGVSNDFTLSFERNICFSETEGTSREKEEESSFIDGYYLDVDILVSNEILMNWPAKVLCDEDCKGICNVCGQNLNRKTCDCDTVVLDPRMAAIKDIYKSMQSDDV